MNERFIQRLVKLLPMKRVTFALTLSGSRMYDCWHGHFDEWSVTKINR